MLILSRKNGETIVIDGQITLTVLEVRGNVVRLGINAPRDIAVYRGEIHARILADAALERGALELDVGGGVETPPPVPRLAPASRPALAASNRRQVQTAWRCQSPPAGSPPALCNPADS